MNQSQNGRPASNAEPTSPESAPDHVYGLVTRAGDEPSGEFGMDNDAGSGGHTLLSRPPLPQGRKSLFRR